MNILILGNGFDLAHKLPTKYTDFLRFTSAIKLCLGGNENQLRDTYSKEIHTEILAMIEENVKNRELEWRDLLTENFWISYFSQCPMYQKENWIDFESEISNVIQSLDRDMVIDDGGKYQFTEEINKCLTNDFLDTYFEEHAFVGKYDKNGKSCGELSYKAIRDTLYTDLNKLTRALEIYLDEYVSKVNCNLISPDIEKIKFTTNKKTTIENNISLSKILSFNYTSTYRRLYFNDSIEDNFEDFIHGKADINNTVETNNMVLGIDEYLSENRKNIDVEFIAFKKFYQQIYKETGCKYKDWLEIIRQDSHKKSFLYDNKDHSKDFVHNLYIFGHSLDVTDADILRDLIKNDNVYTTIFYFDKDDMGRKIANLVKVIGQDELIKRTGGSTKTIEFKKQADMVTI